jgi:hypothetical protein
MPMFCRLEKERYVTHGCPQAGAVGPPIIYLSDDDDNEEENHIVKTRSFPGKKLMPLNSS